MLVRQAFARTVTSTAIAVVPWLASLDEPVRVLAGIAGIVYAVVATYVLVKNHFR